MKNITKGTEPRSLVEHRCQTAADFDNFSDKQGLRDALVQEQGFVCCYCMGRIMPDALKMKVEHWHCQDMHPTEQLDYSNLLGACNGGMGQAPRLQHCDTKKGSQLLSLNPANPAHRVEQTLRYLGDGTLKSTDPTFDIELNTVLNLNLSQLKLNRVGALDAFIATLPTKGTYTPNLLRTRLEKLKQGENGYLEPFVQIIIAWVEKKQARGGTR